MTMIELKKEVASLNPKRQVELAAFLMPSAVGDKPGKAHPSRLARECAKLQKMKNMTWLTSV